MLSKLGGIRLVLAVAAAILALGAWAQAPATRAADDPVAVLQAFIGAVNGGDATASAAFFTDDGTFIDINGGSFGLFGRAAVEFAFQDIGTQGTHVTLTSSHVSGTTVTGTIEYSDNTTAVAGVTRVVQPLTAEVVNGKIASIVLRYDRSDAQTATYLAYQDAHQDQGDQGPPPTDQVQLTMGGNQAGDSGVGAFEGVSFVFIGIAPGQDGVEQPAAIRSGTCDHLGGVEQQLAPVLGGNASAIISVTLDHLLASAHAMTVSDSPDNPDVIVSCAEIERGAAPAPTAGGTQLPNTGSGGSTGGSSFVLLALALAALGVVAIATSGGMRFAMRRR